jgi:hypothetical protein
MGAMILVLSRPVDAEAEAEYNRWYEQQHIPDMFRASEKVSRVTRLRLSASQLGDTPDFAYVALYEVDAQETGELVKEISSALAAGEIVSTASIDMGPVYFLAEVADFRRDGQG